MDGANPRENFRTFLRAGQRSVAAARSAPPEVAKLQPAHHPEGERGHGPTVDDSLIQSLHSIMGTIPSTQHASSSDDEALAASTAAMHALSARVFSEAGARSSPPRARTGKRPEDDTDSPVNSDDEVPAEDHAGAELPAGHESHRWRKYGCKHIRASQDYRNYFKCSVKDCNVKKIEHVRFTSANAPPTVTVSIRGEHAHQCQTDVKKMRLSTQEDLRALISADSAPDASPPPEPARKPTAGGAAASAAAPEAYAAPPGSPSASQANGGQLVVVATGDVDPADDGWQWRKYGQKQVKDSPFPRSYYRCSETGCPARKKVQNSNAQRYITYEGQHNHAQPTKVGNRKRRKSETAPHD